MQRYKRSHAAVLTVALAAALATTAAPAVAEPTAAAAGDCPFTRTLCLFEGEDFTGERFTPSSGTCVNLGDHGWDGGRANSAINTGSNSAILFMNADCEGDPFQIPPNSSRADFGSFSPNSVLAQG